MKKKELIGLNLTHLFDKVPTGTILQCAEFMNTVRGLNGTDEYLLIKGPYKDSPSSAYIYVDIVCMRTLKITRGWYSHRFTVKRIPTKKERNKLLIAYSII